MSLTNWSNPLSSNWNPFDRAERRMSQMMHHFFNDDNLSAMSRNRGDRANWAERLQKDWTATPVVDVIETDKEWLVQAELPGVQKNDIKLDIQNDALVLSAETKSTHKMTTETMRYQERHTGKFSRTMSLPDGIDRDNVDAKFENGVLTVTLPKNVDAKPTKSITVS